MDRIQYQIVTSVVEVEDKKYETYGIRCVKNNKVIETVEDISVDDRKIKNLINALNEGQLDPDQLIDVIDDIL